MVAAEYIAQEIKKITDHVYMMVGGGSMYLNDAIGRSGLKYICMHNEQALSMAAEADARITEKPSFCIVTTGPGSTNAITGLYGAWVDSIPVVFISGQVKTSTMKSPKMRQLGDQEVDIVSIVSPLTKFAVTVEKPELVPVFLYKAIKEATSGRPGPVWLDIPLDVQSGESGEGFEITKRDMVPHLQQSYILEVIGILKKAERPVIIAGSGIRHAHALDSFSSIMSKLQIPTIPSFNARDIYPFKYPSFGMLGDERCNRIINQSDVLLVLGCRMNIRQIGWDFGRLAKGAYKIMVDVDPIELDKTTFAAEFQIVADLWEFLSALDCHLAPYENMWAPIPTKEEYVADVKYVSPRGIVESLNEVTKPGDILVFANGIYTAEVLRDVELKKDMRLIINSGCGAMGYGLPAAIGAAVAGKGRRVFCFEGDGSIQLNIQELQTIRHHKLPIKIFVGENNGYGSIRNTQDNYFGGFHVGADKSCGVSFPDMVALAEAYGFRYGELTCDVWKHISFKWVIDQTRPVICSMKMDPNYKARKAAI